MDYRITKLEKGCFVVEYREKPFSWFPWKSVDKTFKTKTKAEEFIRGWKSARELNMKK